jgi:hypothetical protein
MTIGELQGEILDWKRAAEDRIRHDLRSGKYGTKVLTARADLDRVAREAKRLYFELEAKRADLDRTRARVLLELQAIALEIHPAKTVQGGGS